MDWLKDVNKRLAETRDQKFRKTSQARLDGFNAQKATLQETLNQKLKEDPNYFIKQNKKIAENKKAKAQKDLNYAKNIKESHKNRGKKWADKFKDKQYAKEYSIKVSKSKPTQVSPEIAFKIYYACLEPREEVRTAKYMTKLGKKYGLTLYRVRQIAYGDHYAFGGERVTEKNIRINQTEINPKADYEAWKRIVIGIFKFTSPEGKIYEFDNYIDAGNFMLELEGKSSGNPYTKCYKKFMHLEDNIPKVMQLGFWKNWILERVR